MKKLLSIIFSISLVLSVCYIPRQAYAADVMLVNSAVPINFVTTANPDIQLSGFTALEYGDLKCKITIKNTSITNDYRLPIYFLGKDENGKVIETNATYLNIGKSPTKDIQNPNKTITKVLDTDHITTAEVEIPLKAGFFIKSVECGVVPKTSDKISIYNYGIRRDDKQNKIIVTGIVNDNIQYPFSAKDTEIHQNGGFVAIGYDKNNKIVEVQGASDNVPNGAVKNFEVVFLAGSLIDHLELRPTGGSDQTFNNVFGSRVEKGKTIITGNIENNPYSQYSQVFVTGSRNNKVVDVDGQTMSIEKNANANYRFELNENDLTDVQVNARQQKDIAGKGELLTYSTHREHGTVIVDALVSSGYYKAKNLGIIVDGLDKDGKSIETNSAVTNFSDNKCEVKHVTTTLNAGDRIQDVKAGLAGDLEDEIKLRDYSYRVENGNYLVTSIIENGNTIDQTAGVAVTGYDSKGNKVEVTGYSDKLPANTTKQYTSLLKNTKEISKASAELVGIVKNKVEAESAYCKDANNVIVSGILLNGSGKHNAGYIAIGLDSKNRVVDTDCFYGPLDEDTVQPFYLTLNKANKVSKVKTQLVEETSLNPSVVLNGSGCYLDKDHIQINSVVTNGTTLPQQVGVISIGYDTKGRIVDTSISGAAQVPQSTVMKIQSTLTNINKVSYSKSILYGVKCPTDIYCAYTQQLPNSNVRQYNLCIRNGAGDQDFTVKTTMYDLKGKLITPTVQTFHVVKYAPQLAAIQYDPTTVSKVVVQVYDSSNKKVSGKGVSDIIYKKYVAPPKKPAKKSVNKSVKKAVKPAKKSKK